MDDVIKTTTIFFFIVLAGLGVIYFSGIFCDASAGDPAMPAAVIGFVCTDPDKFAAVILVFCFLAGLALELAYIGMR